MIRKLLFLSIMLVGVALLQVGCGSDDETTTEPTVVPEPRLVVESHQYFDLADALTTPVWDSIDAVSIHLGTDTMYNADLARTDAVVSMKALAADDSILYIWAQWGDGDADDRFGQLHGVWSINSVIWEKGDTTVYNEDRFFIIFDNGGTNGADCHSFCHSSGEVSSAGRRFYGTAGDDVDIWQWLANRTGPARFAEDLHITDSMVFHDPQARPADSLYFGNYDNINSQPKNMHQDGNLFTGPALLEGEFVTFDPNLDWVTFPPNQSPVGKFVPGLYFLNNSLSRGSRWDVRTISEYSGLKWTVVFRRLMTTADAADIDFAGISDSVAFTIAFSDNIGVKHYGHAPIYMIFK